jgi:hypothetical protein
VDASVALERSLPPNKKIIKREKETELVNHLAAWIVEAPLIKK